MNDMLLVLMARLRIKAGASSLVEYWLLTNGGHVPRHLDPTVTPADEELEDG
jgi:hypothetical protein